LASCTRCSARCRRGAIAGGVVDAKLHRKKSPSALTRQKQKGISPNVDFSDHTKRAKKSTLATPGNGVIDQRTTTQIRATAEACCVMCRRSQPTGGARVSSNPGCTEQSCRSSRRKRHAKHCVYLYSGLGLRSHRVGPGCHIFADRARTAASSAWRWPPQPTKTISNISSNVACLPTASTSASHEVLFRGARPAHRRWIANGRRIAANIAKLLGLLTRA
jgi:hypothetical protein